MRILVIEDQADLREIVVETFREEGHATDSSADGEEGLYKAINWDYDVIILDVMLPKMNGWHVLQKLRLTKQTPVLMLTALSEVKDRIKGLNFGADDYLPKPFDLEELIARVGALIRRSGGESSPEIVVGDIKINRASKQIFVSGSEIEFTAREFALVELLVNRRGQFASRTYLYDHLFDENDDSLSNMLDVYIYKIRQKLGKEFIRTKRGQGYIVDVPS